MKDSDLCREYRWLEIALKFVYQISWKSEEDQFWDFGFELGWGELILNMVWGWAQVSSGSDNWQLEGSYKSGHELHDP